MYYYQCDWCGGQIDTQQPYAKANIKIVSASRDRLGRREETVEPTRFFHANPLRSLDEWDRLGIEVKDEGLSDCCYTRALNQIEGEPDSGTPDMGMEWRLVPVDAPVGETRAAPTSKPVPADADLGDFLATLAPSPRHALSRTLERAGVDTLEGLEALTVDDLMEMPGIGWTTVKKIRAFIAARGEASREKATA
jgi:hypothetical protein